MQDKEKIAFFDFCGTIVPFQSANAYVEFVVNNYANLIRKTKLAIIKTARRIHLLSPFLRVFYGGINDKLLYLKLIKGVSYNTLDVAARRFYEEKIKPSIIPEVIEELKKRQHDNYRIVIISGALDVYLRYFAEDYCIKDIISSNMELEKGFFTGKLSGRDCMGENKVRELEQRFIRKDLFCVAYSDSPSDLPLLTWVDVGFAVLKRPSWIITNSIKEYYWDER